MKPRSKKGRFLKGVSYNPDGTFKKGYTWREPKPYWDRDWLHYEYFEKRKPAKQIAKEQGCGENNILYFLKKFNIPTRTMEEIRAKKHWGVKGKDNPMYGKYGKLNPNWNGGCTPDRQSFYSSLEWKQCISEVWRRDKATCQNCGIKKKKGMKFVIHHIESFAIKEKRVDISNF